MKKKCSWICKAVTIALIIGLALLLYATGLYEKLYHALWSDGASNTLKQMGGYTYGHSVAVYIGSMILIVALSLPIVIPVVIASGYLFGLFLGALYSVIATVIGALVPFLIVRYLCGNYIKKRYSKKFATFNTRVEQYGANYVLVLHYLAIVPFFIINTFAGLTNMSLMTFMRLTALGSFPVYLIYTFAGHELSEVNSLSDMLSWPVIIAMLLLLLLAAIPIVIQRLKGSSAYLDEDKESTENSTASKNAQTPHRGHKEK